MTNFICSRCGHTQPLTTLRPSCACGGLWQLDFQPPAFDLALVEQNEWSIFRYRKFMTPIGEAWRDISLGEGLTPVIRFDKDVWLKMDYCMPTLSFKDRGAAVLIAHCKDIGVKAVAQDSSGNAGNSVAAYCGKSGIDCEIFVPEHTSPKKIAMIRAHGARVNIISGSRDDCAHACRDKIAKEGLFYASHVYNPLFYEGTKTYIYEVYEQMRRIPQNIFVPLGNGTLFIGVIKALQHLLQSGTIAEMPRLFAVQSERCAPFVQAAAKHSPHAERVNPADTLAEGIAIGEPMRDEEILSYIYKYNIEVITAPEEKILPARAALAATGVYCEHTTAATYAAYLSYCEQHGHLPDSLLPMCGAGLKSDH